MNKNSNKPIGSELKTPVNVMVRNDLDRQTKALLAIIPLKFKERLKFGAKSLAMSLGIALLCVFIPVFHFVLVPSAILVGLALFYRQFTFHELLLGGKVSCPQCQSEFELKKAGFNWPRLETCPHCRAELTLKK